jgi:ribosomal protein S18 acetylase RimI-like enzyme
MLEQPKPASIDIQTHVVDRSEDCPAWTSWDDLAAFLHDSLKPYEDTISDIRRGIDNAFREHDGRRGFVLIAETGRRPVGALVMLRTGMKGYIPENLLLFVAVAPSMRGHAIGRRLVQKAIERTGGDIKLHVEYDNPAKRLYERLGFQSKYAEIRYTK